MIVSFRHRGLRALYYERSSRRVIAHHVPKLKRILATLDNSHSPRGMDLPGFRLHSLSGRLRGHYAVAVSGNWRVTFRFYDGEVYDVDYVDYHN